MILPEHKNLTFDDDPATLAFYLLDAGLPDLAERASRGEFTTKSGRERLLSLLERWLAQHNGTPRCRVIPFRKPTGVR